MMALAMPISILACLLIIILSSSTSNALTLPKNARPITIESPVDHQSQSFLGTLDEIKFLTNQAKLRRFEQHQILNAVSRILRNVNPNVSIQKRLNRVDAFKRVQNIRKNLDKFKTPFAFHLQLSRLFSALNDVHTIYLPPNPMRSAYAALGFFVDRAFDSNNNEKYLMTGRWPSLPFIDDSFVPGVTITKVDGKPIREVVLDLGKKGFFNGVDRQIRWGLNFLTFRDLIIVGAVRETSSNFTYIDLNGTTKEINVPIQYIYSVPSNSSESTSRSVLQSDAAKNSKKFPVRRFGVPASQQTKVQSLLKDGHQATAGSGKKFMTSKKNFLTRELITVNPTYSGLLVAENMRVGNMTFSRIAVNSFDLLNPQILNETLDVFYQGWRSELIRLLGLVDPNNLIIDTRFNLGGYALPVLTLWQVVTRQSLNVPRSPTVSSAKPLMSEIFRAYNDTSLIENFRTHNLAGYDLSGPWGDVYETPLRGTYPREDQVYFGNVVHLIGGFSTSAAELHVSIVRDISRGLVVGVDPFTTGAGASTVSYSQFAQDIPQVFKPLPDGVDFSTAFGRFFRGGPKDGALVEYFGVDATERYRESERDVLEGGTDMYEYLASKLAQM